MSDIILYSSHFRIGDLVHVGNDMSIQASIVSISITGNYVDQREYKAQWWVNGDPKEHWFHPWQLRSVECL